MGTYFLCIVWLQGNPEVAGYIFIQHKIKPAKLHGCRWDGKKPAYIVECPMKWHLQTCGMMVKHVCDNSWNHQFYFGGSMILIAIFVAPLAFTNDVRTLSMRLWSVISGNSYPDPWIYTANWVREKNLNKPVALKRNQKKLTATSLPKVVVVVVAEFGPFKKSLDKASFRRTSWDGSWNNAGIPPVMH